MIINTPKKEAREVSFGELSVGEGFRWQSWYYIKVEECQKKLNGVERQNCNAVQLESGYLAHFMFCELVEKIPMSIEVLE